MAPFVNFGWKMSKGSRQRPTDHNRFSSNWDAIFNKELPMAKSMGDTGVGQRTVKTSSAKGVSMKEDGKNSWGPKDIGESRWKPGSAQKSFKAPTMKDC